MTGSNIKLALKIQEHLNLFDNVYASDKNNNLVGKAKLQLIIEKFGKEILDHKGIINRQILGKIVFSNPKKLEHKGFIFKNGNILVNYFQKILKNL